LTEIHVQPRVGILPTKDMSVHLASTLLLFGKRETISTEVNSKSNTEWGIF